MNTALSFVPLLLMVTIIPLFYALCLKLSARILKGRLVSWKHSFIFSLIIILINLAIRAVTFFLDVTIPIPFGLILAFLLNISIGTWFFSKRATYANGQELGLRGGLEMTLLSLVLIALSGAVLTVGFALLRTTITT